jgi:cysteine desulfurase / selenocysteine lyase
MSFDIKNIRNDFPALHQKVNGKPLIYMDNGATTQKPLSVIQRITELYTSYNSTIHRGVHHNSNIMTDWYEKTRESVSSFLNAKHKHEIIFTGNTTSSINLVAQTWGKVNIKKGDEIIISLAEHHANFVPWQILCQQNEAKLVVVPPEKNGDIDPERIIEKITGRTKFISVTHVSNITGFVTPVREIIKAAHQQNVTVMLDGAQAAQHGGIDVQLLDCDFYAFSAHKVYGPTGVGILYGKEHLLEKMPPWQTGGSMVDKVSEEKTTFNQLPFKFEAGTPNYIDVIAFEEALKYLNKTGWENIHKYERELAGYLREKILELPEIEILGKTKHQIPLISFNIKGVHHLDAGMVLDKMGISLRTGSLCAQPFLRFFGCDGTIRASLCFYNTFEEIDKLQNALKKTIMMF